MKKNSNLGKSLTKEEMKKIMGGGTPCHTYLDCSCGRIPEPMYGEVCVNGTCQKLGIGACP